MPGWILSSCGLLIGALRGRPMAAELPTVRNDFYGNATNVVQAGYISYQLSGQVYGLREYQRPTNRTRPGCLRNPAAC